MAMADRAEEQGRSPDAYVRRQSNVPGMHIVSDHCGTGSGVLSSASGTSPCLVLSRCPISSNVGRDVPLLAHGSHTPRRSCYTRGPAVRWQLL